MRAVLARGEIEAQREDPNAAEQFATNPSHWLQWLQEKLLNSTGDEGVRQRRKILFRRFAEVPGKVGGVADVSAQSFKITAQGGQIEVLKAKFEDGKKIDGGDLAQAAGFSPDTVLGG